MAKNVNMNLMWLIIAAVIIAIGMAGFYGQKHIRSLQDEVNLCRARLDLAVNRDEAAEIARGVVREHRTQDHQVEN